MSKFGHFSPDGSEYIITDPNTPKPWVNFLSNRRYCALVSATGGGYSFVDDAQYNRITREVPGDQILEDRPGRYLFIKDTDSGQVWSATWQPVMGHYDSWEAVHGLGYTKICNTTYHIETEIEYFVPLEDTVEVWRVSVQNQDKKSRNLSLYTYVEWALGYFSNDLLDRNFSSFFNKIFFEDNAILATKTRNERPDKPGYPWEKWAFMSGSVKFDGWDCSRNTFLGQNHYLSNPKTISIDKTINSNAIGEEGVGVLNKKISLEPGNKFEMVIVLGVAETRSQVRKLISKYSRKTDVQKEYRQMRKFWQNFLSKCEVITPDHSFNTSVNFWNKYQTWITSVWGESDSLYIGSSNIGFRDECQHIYGILPLDTQLAEEILIELLKNQYQEGYVNHNWNRTTGKGNVTYHSDDCQWLVMAIINYIEETKDFEFLNKKVPYYDIEEATVLEHLIKAMDYTLYHVSPEGIPLRLTADWNDALGGGHLGKGESLMVANQVCWNITRLVPLLDSLITGDGKNRKFGHHLEDGLLDGKKITQTVLHNLMDRYQHIYQRIKETVNHNFWDGEWYIRATDDFGNHIGSCHNKEGKIHLDGQTWALMSGIAGEVRGTRAMNSVWEHLGTRYGPCIFLPSYTHYSKAFGIISQFAPGTKENGTIFSHLVAWAVIAECILGRGDKAYELWKKSSFVIRGEDPDLYQVEPYVYSEFVFGPENPNFGRGSYSWMTGSAAWFLRACTDWILGVRPTLDGLFIDPCIPKSWKSYKIKRVFRGVTYDIEVLNPKGVEKGVERIEVDGKLIKGSLLPHKKVGNLDVKVIMG